MPVTRRYVRRIVAQGAGAANDAQFVDEAGDTMSGPLAVEINANGSYAGTFNNWHASGHGIQMGLGGATGNAFCCAASGDNHHRLLIDASGKLAWGNGTDARDTTLERQGVNALRTPGALAVGAAGAYVGLNWGPADHGYLTWAYDVAYSSGTAVALATAGTIYTIRLHNPVARNVTNIVTYLSAAGSSLTSGQCFASLFRADTGALLGTTADQTTAWGTTGLKTMAISGGPVAAPAGDLIVGMWFNGTTGPAPFRTNGVALINAGLAAAASRWGTADTSRTTTAPSTLATIAAANTAYWAALS